MDENNAPRTIHAVERASSIIMALKNEGSMGVTDLSSKLDTSKGTIHTHLTTLSQEGFVVKNDDEYRLSLQFLGIAESVKDRIEIYELVQDEVDSLAERTGERAQFGVLENNKSVFVYRNSGENAVQSSVGIGEYVYPHCIAVGKAMLAYLPNHRLEDVIEQHGLPKFTENTIGNKEELKSELDEIREREYAVDDEERVRGIRCIATPLRDEMGRVLGGISVSGPARRLSDERIENSLKADLLQAANVIEVNAEFS